MAVIFRPDPDNPQPRVVTRRCPVCEWEGIVVVGSQDEEDCPQCHAPTAIDVPAEGTKNPHAAASDGWEASAAARRGRKRCRRNAARRSPATPRWRAGENADRIAPAEIRYRNRPPDLLVRRQFCAACTCPGAKQCAGDPRHEPCPATSPRHYETGFSERPRAAISRGSNCHECQPVHSRMRTTPTRQ